MKIRRCISVNVISTDGTEYTVSNIYLKNGHASEVERLDEAEEFVNNNLTNVKHWEIAYGL